MFKAFSGSFPALVSWHLPAVTNTISALYVGSRGTKNLPRWHSPYRFCTLDPKAQALPFRACTLSFLSPGLPLLGPWPCSWAVRASLGLSVSPADLYCTLEVDSFGYFVSKAKTRVFRDTTEPKWDEVSRGGLCPSLSLSMPLCCGWLDQLCLPYPVLPVSHLPADQYLGQ